MGQKNGSAQPHAPVASGGAVFCHGVFHMRTRVDGSQCRCDWRGHGATTDEAARCCSVPVHATAYGSPCGRGTGRAQPWRRSSRAKPCQTARMLRGTDGPMPTSHRLDHEHPQPSTRALTVAAPETLLPSAHCPRSTCRRHPSICLGTTCSPTAVRYSTVRRIGPPSLSVTIFGITTPPLPLVPSRAHPTPSFRYWVAAICSLDITRQLATPMMP